MTSQKSTISQVRKNIDDIDDEILSLMKKRLSFAKEIGRLKDKKQKAKWDPSRESQIYERLLKQNEDVIPKKVILSIFKEIITTCRSIQEKNRVACPGPKSGLAHLAGMKHFGHSASFTHHETIDEIFSDVEKRRIQYGVVPVESSSGSSSFSTFRSLTHHDVKISGEVIIEDNYNLVCRSGNIEDLKTLATHSRPLSLCGEWLKNNLSDISVLPVSSTDAATHMALEDHEVGAIAPELAVKTYDLQVAGKGIEDQKGNYSRFFIISPDSPPPSGNDKSSVRVSLNEHGSFNEILSILSKDNINIEKIESIPAIDRKREYDFFLDITGHIEDHNVQSCVRLLQEKSSVFQWFGSYPRDTK